MKRVVVIGGGIAGLAAAYELHKAGAAVTVVEKDRLGGVIRTEDQDGFLIEGGPDSFITAKPWAKELCEEIGLGDQLIPTLSRKVWVWSGGRLHEMPEGVFLTVPTKFWPFMTNSLISFCGKLRMAMDLVLPRGEEVEDESIGSFIRRRLGQEALEKLAEPIMAGIYVSSADDLSLRSTFPKFAEMEREHRSLIKALRKAAKARGEEAGNVSPFLSLRAGMYDLVQRLIDKMPGVTFVTGREAVKIEPKWRVALSGDGMLEADSVILAIPTYAAARLWPGIPPVKYVTTTTVSLAYKRFDAPEGTGFVIPRTENRKILACTWTSNKFEDRAPRDHFLLRCFIKDKPARPDQIAHEEMKEILGVKEDPVLSMSFTWEDRNPVYEVGHLKRMSEFELRLPPGLHLCGSGFHGTGIPDCIKDGRAVARDVLSSP